MIEYMDYENPLISLIAQLGNFPMWLLMIMLFPIPLFFILKFMMNMDLEEPHYHSNSTTYVYTPTKHDNVVKEILLVKCEYCSSKDMIFNKDKPIMNCIHCNAPINYDNTETIIKEIIKVIE